MNRRNSWFYSALLVTFCTFILLITGSPVLLIALDDANSIPLGTFITWAGMIALPLSIYWGVKELRQPTNKLNRILSGFLKTVIVLSILWVSIAYLLAGNLSFTFSEKGTFQGGQVAMKCFWWMSYGICIGAVLTLDIYWILLLFKKKEQFPSK